MSTSAGGISYIGTPPTPMPTLAWMGISATFEHSFTKVTARATFQGVLLRVLVFTTGPKRWAPAFSTTFTCWCGHMPASFLPS